jgi:hypothetical protein
MARACLALKRDRLSVYMNLDAVAYLRDRLDFLLKSDPAEHFEIHLFDELEIHKKDDSMRGPSAWTLVTPSLVPHVAKRGEIRVEGEIVQELPFDLNIMVVPECELDDLARLESTGVLPDDIEVQS